MVGPGHGKHIFRDQPSRGGSDCIWTTLLLIPWSEYNILSYIDVGKETMMAVSRVTHFNHPTITTNKLGYI